MSTLRISGLRVSIAGKQILNGIDLEVSSGEVHAIMGPNGSGKSTLSHALMGHPDYEVNGGSVTLDGEEMLGLPTHVRAAKGLFLASRIWREELHGPAEAAALIERAIAAAPQAPEAPAALETLADLYVEVGPDARERAIDVHQRLLAQDPNRLASYQELARLYGEIGARDKQWCLAATLSFFRKAEPEMEALYRRHRPQRLKLARQPFDDRVWGLALHPDEDRMLGALFALAGAHVAAPAAQAPSSVGLRGRRRVDPIGDARPPVPTVVQLARTLGVTVPDLFVVLPKEVPEAAAAIGVLCRADECQRFVALLGKLPFDTMESGFLPLLLRTGSDVPDSVKLTLIEQLRRMATQKSNALLSTALATYPANGSPKIKSAIDAALHGHTVTSTE